MKLQFQFSIDEANAILQSLAQLPYHRVFGMIQNIQAQAAPQVAALEQAAAQASQSAEPTVAVTEESPA